MKDYGKTSTEYKIRLEDGKVYQGKECKWLQQQLLVYNANVAFAYAKLIRRSVVVDYQIYHDEVLKQGAEALEFNLRLLKRLIVLHLLRNHYIIICTMIIQFQHLMMKLIMNL